MSKPIITSGTFLCHIWRHIGLVVSALDFRSGGRWFEPGHCHHVVSLDNKRYFTLSLFTRMYKWVPAIIMLGSPCDGLASHPGGSSNIPSRFMLQKPELSAGLMGHLACKQTLPSTFLCQYSTKQKHEMTKFKFHGLRGHTKVNF